MSDFLRKLTKGRARRLAELEELGTRLEAATSAHERSGERTRELEALKRAEIPRYRPELRRRNSRKIYALTAEVQTLIAETQGRIDESEAARARFAAVTDAMRRNVARRDLATFGLYLVTGIIGLGYARTFHSWGHRTHLEFYEAVAAIAPVLLVAGFVEIIAMEPVSQWPLLSFAVGDIGAAVAALYVLASHHSTTLTAYLTMWGLAVTVSSIVVTELGRLEVTNKA